MDQSADWINTLPPSEHVVKFSSAALLRPFPVLLTNSLLIDQEAMQQVKSESEERPLVDYKLALDQVIDLAD